jgi:hypothetical protein
MYINYVIRAIKTRKKLSSLLVAFSFVFLLLVQCGQHYLIAYLEWDFQGLVLVCEVGLENFGLKKVVLCFCDIIV